MATVAWRVVTRGLAFGQRSLNQISTLNVPCHLCGPSKHRLLHSRPRSRIVTAQVTRAPQSIRRHYDHTHSRKVHHNVTPATLSYDERHFPAWFVRGGTSNGLLIHRDNLPSKDQWQTILPAAMGSPDAYGRQLDGMGSGISSTSKIMVLGPSSSPEVAPIEYTFVQVGIADGKLDMAGNCGNMSAAVGPVAWDWGLVSDATAKVDFGKTSMVGT